MQAGIKSSQIHMVSVVSFATYSTGTEKSGREIEWNNRDRLHAKTIVRVQLNGIKTQLGETIVVTGDWPELCNWNIDQAYALRYINDNTWFGKIPFNESAGKAITFKYAIRRENQRPIYENLVCRRWILVNQGIVKWQDV